MKKIGLIICLQLSFIALTIAQNGTYNRITFVKSDGSDNYDPTYFYRDDQIKDKTCIKLIMGDESSSDFQIGYTYFNDGQWYKTFSLDGAGNGFFKGKLEVSTDLYINSGWLRVKGKRGLYFQDYGGGFYMTDDSWIRTFGSKNFYHNTGIMRTDGTFQVGPNGDRFVVNSKGSVGIGIAAPNSSYKLDVAGTIRAEEILVETNGNTADFVFEENYDLKDLSEVESFINENKHLPEIPSAKDMEEAGVNLAEMNKLLLQKVEELTLYAIEKDKEVQSQKLKVEKVEEANQKMEERLAKIETLLMKDE